MLPTEIPFKPLVDKHSMKIKRRELGSDFTNVSTFIEEK